MFMEPDIDVLREADFWRRAWENARNSSSYVRKRIRDEKETIDFWNKCAPTYGKHTSGRGRERLEKVIALLEQEEILTPETEILDVGCGPGTYALPFAERVRSVAALDGAEEMCRILKEKAKEAGLKNITVLVRLWEDVDIEKEGMSSAFDLVFASMTPAVSNYETLMKLNQASRRYCCFISWAGGKLSRAREELWELIFKEKDTNRGHQIIYPFNLLYSLGYYPTMRYLDSGWVQEEPIDQAVESLCRSFWLYTEITPEVKDTIAKYVQKKAVNGVFRQETRARLGIMIWRVDERTQKKL